MPNGWKILKLILNACGIKVNPTNIITFKSEDLKNEGQGLRFDLPQLGEFATGFVIRYQDKPTLISVRTCQLSLIGTRAILLPHKRIF